jgi:hypothetical protein
LPAKLRARTQAILQRRVEDDSDDAKSIPYRDNFTADRACHFAGPVEVLFSRELLERTMMAAAVMGTIALCAGSHAVISPSTGKTYLRIRSVKDLRADAREARSQVPIHKTTMTLRKEDAQ